MAATLTEFVFRSKNRKYCIWLGLIFVIGLILRLWNICNREIQYDDAFSILLAKQTLPEIVRGTAADTMPPLYYFLLHYWMGLGESLFVVRLLSVLFSMVVILFTMDLVRRVFNPRAAIFTGLILAIVPFQIYHAQDIRMYSLLSLCLIVYFWCFYQLYYENGVKNKLLIWALLLFSGTAALYSHNLAGLALLVSTLLLVLRKQWTHIRSLILAQVIILVGFSPWFFYLPGQLEKVQQAFWTSKPGFIEIFQALLQITIYLPLEGVLLIVGGVISIQILVIVILESIKDKNNFRGVHFFSFIAITLPALLLIISYVMRPVFVPRGFILSGLAYYSLIGFAIDKGWNRGIGKLLLFLWLSAALISLPSLYYDSSFPRSPFKDASDYLSREVKNGDIILHDNKLSYFPMDYYRPELNQKFLADFPGSSNDTLSPETQFVLGVNANNSIMEIKGIGDTLYFVVFSQSIREYELTQGINHPILRELEEMFVKVDQRTFNDLVIYKFMR